MALKIPVLVFSLTNLSDARYCAGMGVPYLCACAEEDLTDFLPDNKFKEISGWLSGPSLGVYVEKQPPQPEYQPYQWIGTNQEKLAAELIEEGHSVVFFLSDNHPTQLGAWAQKLKGLVCLHADLKQAAEWKKQLPQTTLFVFQPELELLDQLAEQNLGLAISGTQELRAGFKDFGYMADALEALEQEDDIVWQ